MNRSRWKRLPKSPGMVFYIRPGRDFVKYILREVSITKNMCGGKFRRSKASSREPDSYIPCEMLYTPGDVDRFLRKEEKQQEEAERRKRDGTGHDTGGR